jgi:hypothetical protein
VAQARNNDQRNRLVAQGITAWVTFAAKRTGYCGPGFSGMGQTQKGFK